MSLSDINEAIITWRSVLMKITGLSKEYILNGESLRGPELVVIKDNKKIPISNTEIAIIHYLDPIDEISVTDSNSDLLLNQSYELHLIIYGNKCRNVAQRIKSSIYSQTILEVLREGGIGLLGIPSYENTSGFRPDNTYTLRYDVRVRFDCVLRTDPLEDDIYIENVDYSIKKKVDSYLYLTDSIDEYLKSIDNEYFKVKGVNDEY